MSLTNHHTAVTPVSQPQFSPAYRAWRDDLLSRPHARLGDPLRVQLRRAVRQAAEAEAARRKYEWSGRAA